MEVKHRNLSEIKPYPGNPRQNDAAVDAVAESIRQFSFRQPVGPRWPMKAVARALEVLGCRTTAGFGSGVAVWPLARRGARRGDGRL